MGKLTKKYVCSNCGTPIWDGSKSGLCHNCYVENQRKLKIESWLATGDTGCGVDTTIRGAIRKFILNEQEHKCAICGCPDIWCGSTLNFVLDHIDGDASNSCRENLRLICPNCDSQLPTYKSKNKNSARNSRKQFLHKYAVKK